MDTHPYTHAESNSVTQAHPPAASLLAQISLGAGEELSMNIRGERRWLTPQINVKYKTNMTSVPDSAENHVSFA